MNPKDQSRRRSFQPIGGRGCLLLSSVVMLALAGCDGLPARRQNDPLRGGIPNPPQPVASTGGTANTPTQTASADPPAPSMPASYVAPGQAALASGEAPTSEPGRDLRIPANTVTPASLPGNGAVRGVAPGVRVGNPEPASSGSTSNLMPVPIAGAAARPSGASAPPIPAGSAAANIRTFEEAQQYLTQHGVDWQRLDQFEPGWWKFQCSARNPKAPNVNHTYCTSQPFSDPLTAIRAVIVKMEQKPQ